MNREYIRDRATVIIVDNDSEFITNIARGTPHLIFTYLQNWR